MTISVMPRVCPVVELLVPNLTKGKLLLEVECTLKPPATIWSPSTSNCDQSFHTTCVSLGLLRDLYRLPRRKGALREVLSDHFAQ